MNTTNDTPRLVTAKPLGDALGLSAQMVGKHRDSGMPAVKADRALADLHGCKLGAWLYDPEACKAWHAATVAICATPKTPHPLASSRQDG